jgi:hypothetical protein
MKLICLTCGVCAALLTWCLFAREHLNTSILLDLSAACVLVLFFFGHDAICEALSESSSSLRAISTSVFAGSIFSISAVLISQKVGINIFFV